MKWFGDYNDKPSYLKRLGVRYRRKLNIKEWEKFCDKSSSMDNTDTNLDNLLRFKGRKGVVR